MAEKTSVMGTGHRCASNVTLHQVLPFVPGHLVLALLGEEGCEPQIPLPGSWFSTQHLESTRQGCSCGIVPGHLPEKTLSQKQAQLHLTN